MLNSVSIIGDFSDIKGIMMALQNIKEKTKREEQQKSEETIAR